MGGSSAGSGGGSGGNTGADAGFFISEQKKKEKINESGYGADYQGDVNPQKKQKKKTTVVNNGGDGGQSYGAESGNNTITQVTKTAPTIAEVDQATTDTSPTETAETTEANRLLKIKKKGRSQSIMTSAKGVTKTSSDYSLGRPSLLGRV